jgi:hypothetical protein
VCTYIRCRVSTSFLPPVHPFGGEDSGDMIPFVQFRSHGCALRVILMQVLGGSCHFRVEYLAGAGTPRVDGGLRSRCAGAWGQRPSAVA